MLTLKSATDPVCTQTGTDDVNLGHGYAIADVSPSHALSVQPHRKDNQFAFARIHGNVVLVQSTQRIRCPLLDELNYHSFYFILFFKIYLSSFANESIDDVVPLT
jgi:hypothetical protein